MEVALPRRKPNQLIQLLERFPNKPWDLNGLSCNPNITMDWILEHPHTHDKMDSGSTNLSCAWVWVQVCSNPNLTMHFLLNTLLPKLEEESKGQSNKLTNQQEVEGSIWGILSVNPGLNYTEIRSHYANCTLEDRLRYKWNWRAMASRSDVTVEMLMLMSIDFTAAGNSQSTNNSNNSNSKFLAAAVGSWDPIFASRNPNLTTAIVLKYPQLWDWPTISRNSAIEPTREFINHPYHLRYDHDLLVRALSGNPRLNFQFVLDDCAGVSWKSDLEEKWYWPLLSQNRAITLEMILAHPELPWSWRNVSSNPNLTEEHLNSPEFELRFPTGGECYDDDICYNSNISADFIIHSRFFVCNSLSDSPNLTARIVMDPENINFSWDWESISHNHFARSKGNNLAKTEEKYHDRVDSTVWSALLFHSGNGHRIDNSDNCRDSRRRLPTPLAKLALEYFSPFY